ncbi:hypothetical protein C8J56DRAFT_1064011 [Mycena floridula]|nr:hypothetical protein C8J56DRAFT_1064011 [Mycena floridula]
MTRPIFDEIGRPASRDNSAKATLFRKLPSTTLDLYKVSSLLLLTSGPSESRIAAVSSSTMPTVYISHSNFDGFPKPTDPPTFLKSVSLCDQHPLFHNNDEPSDAEFALLSKRATTENSHIDLLQCIISFLTRFPRTVALIPFRSFLEGRLDQRCVLTTRIAAVLSPLRRLPTEILSEIFLLTIDDFYPFTPLSLLRVSRRWHDVALSLPRLWAVMVISNNIHGEWEATPTLEQHRRWIACSTGPLLVSFQRPRNKVLHIEQILDIWMTVLDRIQNLDLDFRVVGPYAWNLPSQELPQGGSLRNLVRFRYLAPYVSGNAEYPETLRPWWALSVLRLAAPNLVTLEWGGSEAKLTTIWFPSLTKLVLDQGCVGVYEVIRILGHCPRLQICDVDIYQPPGLLLVYPTSNVPLPTIVTLQDLRDLKITSGAYTAQETFLQLLHLPHLKTLAFDCYGRATSTLFILEFTLHRWKCSLESLSLFGSSWAKQDLRVSWSAFCSHPSIKHVHRFDIEVRANLILVDDLFELLPNLKTLRVYLTPGDVVLLERMLYKGRLPPGFAVEVEPNFSYISDLIDSFSQRVEVTWVMEAIEALKANGLPVANDKRRARDSTFLASTTTTSGFRDLDRYSTGLDAFSETPASRDNSTKATLFRKMSIDEFGSVQVSSPQCLWCPYSIAFQNPLIHRAFIKDLVHVGRLFRVDTTDNPLGELGFVEATFTRKSWVYDIRKRFQNPLLPFFQKFTWYTFFHSPMRFYSKPPAVPVLQHMEFFPVLERKPLQPLQHTLIDCLPRKPTVTASTAVIDDLLRTLDDCIDSRSSSSLDERQSKTDPELPRNLSHHTLMENLPSEPASGSMGVDDTSEVEESKSLNRRCSIDLKPSFSPETGHLQTVIKPEFQIALGGSLNPLRTENYEHAKPPGEAGRHDQRGWELKPELRKCDGAWDDATFQEFKDFISDLVEDRLDKSRPFTRQKQEALVKIYNEVLKRFASLKLDAYQDYWPIRSALMLRLKRTAGTVREREQSDHRPIILGSHRQWSIERPWICLSYLPSTGFISKKSLHHDIRLLCEIHGPTDNYEVRFLFKSSMLAEFAESNRRSTDRQFLQNHRQWPIGRPWLALCSPMFDWFVKPTDPPIIYEGCLLRIQSTLDDFPRPNRPSTDNCCTTTDKWFTGRECSPNIEFDHLKVFGLQDSVTLSNPGFHRHFMKVSTLLFFVKNGSDRSYRPSPGKCTLDSFSDLNLRATDDFRTTDDDSPLGDLDLNVFSPSPAGQGLFRMLIESGSMPEVGEIIQVTAREYYNAASSKTMSIDESGSMKPVLSPERLVSTYSILFETHGSTECIKVFSPSISLTMALNDFIGHVLRTHSTLDDFPGATPNPPLAIQPPIYRPAFSPTKAPAVSMVLSLADVLCVLARMLLNYTSSHNYHEKLNPGASPLKFPTFSSRRLRGLPEAFYSILVTANITCGFTRPESRFVSLSLDLKSLAELVLSTSLSMEKLMQTLLTDAANGSSEAIRDVLTWLQRKGLSAQNRNKGLQRLSDIVLLHLQQPPPTCPTEKFLAKFEPRDTLGPVCFKAVDLAFQHLQGSTREHLLQQWASFCPWLDLFLKKLVATPEADDGEMLYDTMWSIVDHFISHCQTPSLFDSYPGLIALTTGLWIHGSNRNMLSSPNLYCLRSILHGKPPFILGPIRRLAALPVEMAESFADIPGAISTLLNQFGKSCDLDNSQVQHMELLSVITPFLVRHPALRQRLISGGIIEMVCALLNHILRRPRSQKFISSGLFCQSLHILTVTFECHGPFCVRQTMRYRLLSTLATSFKFFGTSGPAVEYLTEDLIKLLRGIEDYLDHPIVLRAAQNALRALFANRDLPQSEILSRDGPDYPKVICVFRLLILKVQSRATDRRIYKDFRHPCANTLAMFLRRAIISGTQEMRWLPRGGILLSRLPESTLEPAYFAMSATIDKYSMAASPTAHNFATAVHLKSFCQLATDVSGGIIQQQIRSALARRSLTVIITPGPEGRMTSETPYALLLPQVLSGAEFLARPNEYGCDKVVNPCSCNLSIPMQPSYTLEFLTPAARCRLQLYELLMGRSLRLQDYKRYWTGLDAFFKTQRPEMNSTDMSLSSNDPTAASKRHSRPHCREKVHNRTSLE